MYKKNPPRDTITEININKEVITAPDEIANQMNENFVNI